MIYIASKTRHAPRWIQHKRDGAPIISSWIYEADVGATCNFSELWTRIQREVSLSKVLILYVEAEDAGKLKGAFIEVGMALAYGVRVIVAAEGFGVPDRGDNFAPHGSWIHHPNVTFLCGQHALERAFSLAHRHLDATS